jgi:phosphoglycolate phosphatase-like HAD superfamily hydrolase
VVFLDDGGVMNDNHVRGPQWQRLVGEFFAPILGGRPEAWGEANQVVATRLFADLDAWSARLRAASDYLSFDRALQLEWLGGMCELMGIPAPTEEESLDLARRANAFVTRRVRAAFPGAVDAIRTLCAQGYTLHTASGESSADLAGYLEGMGVRDCFGRLYGPDLIDTLKAGPEYYERLLAGAGVAPTDALVVDDSPRAVAWAMEVGARAALIGREPYADTGTALRIGSLAELPEIIERLG